MSIRSLLSRFLELVGLRRRKPFDEATFRAALERWDRDDEMPERLSDAFEAHNKIMTEMWAEVVERASARRRAEASRVTDLDVLGARLLWHEAAPPGWQGLIEARADDQARGGSTT